jgi:hypothetical protein
MHRTRFGTAAALVFLLALIAPPASPAVTSCPKPPKVDPSNFPSQPKIDNAYFPLTPGKTYIYKGKEDGEPSEDHFAVTSGTKVLDGVTTRVIHDQGFVNNELTEDTKDYFAQDKDGTVWYFGEDTKEIDNGQVVSTEGSWRAGVKGANAGIFMPRHPQVGQVFTQEDAGKVAHDCFQVLDLNASVKVPYGSFNHALRTKEFSPLEPDVVENKWYAKTIGDVREKTVQGGNDFLELVSIK